MGALEAHPVAKMGFIVQVTTHPVILSDRNEVEGVEGSWHLIDRKCNHKCEDPSTSLRFAQDDNAVGGLQTER